MSAGDLLLPKLKGSFVALITPFTSDNRIDVKTLQRLVDFHLNAGTNGLVVCGTTGEAPTLNDREFSTVLETVVQSNNGKIPVIAGCGTNSTEGTIHRGNIAGKCGVDGLLVVTPYYNRPNQLGLQNHFVKVAESVGLPVMLYNVPSRTGADILPDTVCKLSTHELIVGLKEATGSLTRLLDIMYHIPSDFALLSGDDFTALPFIISGGAGVISVVANVTPALMAQLCRDALQGEIGAARETHKRMYPLIHLLFKDTNPIPVKKAMQLLGFGNGQLRSPLTEATAELAQKLQNYMNELGA